MSKGRKDGIKKTSDAHAIKSQRKWAKCKDDTFGLMFSRVTGEDFLEDIAEDEEEEENESEEDRDR